MLLQLQLRMILLLPTATLMVQLWLLKGLLHCAGSAYQCLFLVHYVSCQVPNDEHWRSVAVLCVNTQPSLNMYACTSEFKQF